ncbi:ribonucleoside triphosphate reductase [candidate division WS5 bacterium]|uniref:Ribonucleoside triphosphate reductase n=1 Tax=candidate division WS5 bacterium TaxID=2093353 RepID=A0A419DE23_9BACT|nr:MAG: ribonucleoside triphosphate reductase [candidate division WS5 bacterium]
MAKKPSAAKKEQGRLNIPEKYLKKEPFKKIRKRSGEIVKFDPEKITIAIGKAGEATGEFGPSIARKLSDQVVKFLYKKFDNSNIPQVEQIQDAVEHILIESVFEETAKAYIIYRRKHAELRDIKPLLDSDALVEDYLSRGDWRVKENSNMNFSLQGMHVFVSERVVQRYWLNKVYTERIKKAQEGGDLHVHDLGYLSTYCCGWDLKDLLMKGITGISGKVESGPPKHLRTALGQLVNFLFTTQQESAGAQAVSSFDTLLAPFIRYDNLNYKQVKQAMQEFIYNMNVPTRVGFQTPFTNITLDLVPSGIIAKENVIVGGEIKKEKYGDFQKEMDMVNKAFAEIMLRGDHRGRIFTFPIPTYNITKDFDWDNPVLDSVWKMTAKYGIPYFSNFINSDMNPDDARSMCCRLRLDNRELRQRGGGFFGANPLTGSIGVVTINMPRIGYLAKNKKDYYKRLDELMDVAKESLEIKRKLLERMTENGLYPYSERYLSDIKARMGAYWKNHFNTIGILGMNESIANFMKGENITTEKGKKFAEEIMEHIREKMVEFQKETGNMYNLEATPGEGTSRRFANKDKEVYSDIIVANEEAVKFGAKPYYTNSSQLPVNHTDDIFEALSLQDSLQTKYTGGTVLHLFVGEKIDDPNQTKKLVKKIAENYHLPYFTITPTFSVCPKHGYLAGEYKYCPKCDKEIGYNQKEQVSMAEFVGANSR